MVSLVLTGGGPYPTGRASACDCKVPEPPGGATNWPWRKQHPPLLGSGPAGRSSWLAPGGSRSGRAPSRRSTPSQPQPAHQPAAAGGERAIRPWLLPMGLGGPAVTDSRNSSAGSKSRLETQDGLDVYLHQLPQSPLGPPELAGSSGPIGSRRFACPHRGGRKHPTKRGVFLGWEGQGHHCVHGSPARRKSRRPGPISARLESWEHAGAVVAGHGMAIRLLLITSRPPGRRPAPSAAAFAVCFQSTWPVDTRRPKLVKSQAQAEPGISGVRSAGSAEKGAPENPTDAGSEELTIPSRWPARLARRWPPGPTRSCPVPDRDQGHNTSLQGSSRCCQPLFAGSSRALPACLAQQGTRRCLTWLRMAREPGRAAVAAGPVRPPLPILLL